MLYSGGVRGEHLNSIGGAKLDTDINSFRGGGDKPELKRKFTHDYVANMYYGLQFGRLVMC